MPVQPQAPRVAAKRGAWQVNEIRVMNQCHVQSVRPSMKSTLHILPISLSLAAALLAQQPTVDNAKLETRAITGTLASTFTQAGAGPYWAAWSEPIVPGRHGDMCSWFRNGNGNDESGRTPGTPVRLEGEIALVVLVRVEFGQAGDFRVSSPDCHLDAGGLPFYWFTGVPVSESLAWLKSQASGPRGDSAIMAIALHQSPAADQTLDELSAPTQPLEVRKRTANWLGNARGARGVASLKKMLASDPSSDVRDRVVLALSQTKDPGGMALVVDAARNDKDPHIRSQALMWLAQRATAQLSRETIQNAIASDPESAVRERAVTALSQMPNGEGVPLLIDLAKSHRDPAVRKKAMTMLGQSKDPRAIDYFAQVLKP